MDTPDRPKQQQEETDERPPEEVMAMSEDFRRHYTDQSFQEKVRTVFVQAGKKMIEVALSLYAMLRDPSVPDWAKAVILGALGYFVLPADVIPDILPGLGYSDDLGLITGAITAVGRFMTDEHRAWARTQTDRLFEKHPPRAEG